MTKRRTSLQPRFLSFRCAAWLLVPGLLATLNSGCGDDEVEDEVRHRPVRVLEVAYRTDGTSQAFPGTVESARQARLTFKVAGTV